MNAYYNGKFSDTEDVSVPLSDRSVFFGDGIYDALIGRRERIFMLGEHMERFYRNARKMELNAPEKSYVIPIFERLINENKSEFFFIYLQLSRVSKMRAHAYETKL